MRSAKESLISVIVPVYNVENYIDRCILSICKQTYVNLEIIIIDDGSTDSSKMKCDEWALKDERIKVVHKKNGGLSDARNVGISKATGDYFVFVDSDDVVSESLIEYLYKLISIHDAQISICDPVHCYPDCEIAFSNSDDVDIYNSEEAICEMLYQTTFLVSAWAKMFDKKIFSDISFPIGLLFEDSAIMYLLFENAKKIIYGKSKLYGYLHREDSITTKKFSNRDCDIIKISNEIVAWSQCKTDKLQKASKAYQVTAALRIYLNAKPEKEYINQIKWAEIVIKKEALNIFRDKSCRKKLRISVFLFVFARPLMRRIYKHINRWK